MCSPEIFFDAELVEHGKIDPAFPCFFDAGRVMGDQMTNSLGKSLLCQKLRAVDRICSGDKI